MSFTLNFTVVNAQVVTMTSETTHDGNPAVLTFDRAVIEAVPAEGDGKTLTVVLPAEAVQTITEGATIAVTLAVVTTEQGA